MRERNRLRARCRAKQKKRGAGSGENRVRSAVLGCLTQQKHALRRENAGTGLWEEAEIKLIIDNI